VGVRRGGIQRCLPVRHSGSARSHAALCSPPPPPHLRCSAHTLSHPRSYLFRRIRRSSTGGLCASYRHLSGRRRHFCYALCHFLDARRGTGLTLGAAAASATARRFLHRWQQYVERMLGGGPRWKQARAAPHRRQHSRHSALLHRRHQLRLVLWGGRGRGRG
jgi:hypothetical protein